MAETSVIFGRDLSPDELKLINACRKQEFNSSNAIDPAPTNDEWDKPYFFIHDDGCVVAFARLHTIEVEIQGVRHRILGVATVVAVVKGRGYGSRLMAGMKDYIEQSGLTAIGFCNSKTSVFYAKCGYSIAKNGLGRFKFYDANGTEIASRYPTGDVLYLDGRDHLMRKLFKSSDARISAFRPEW